MWRLSTVPALVLCGAMSASVDTAQRPLPDEEVFFPKVRARLASNARIQAEYVYKERETEYGMNPFGRMGTGPAELYQVFPSPAPDMTYRRLLARDGTPVSAEDIATQDREFLEEYNEWLERLAREGTNERDARLAAREEERKEEAEEARKVLEMFEFTIDRRDRLRGQRAIVIRFEPVADPDPPSRRARVASRFAGEAWVHEHDYELMRIEGTAIDDVSFGWGIIGRLHKGAKVLVERRKIGERWLPVETRFTGTGRALLVRTVEFKYVHQYFDYEPFDPARLPEILAASAPGNK